MRNVVRDGPNEQRNSAMSRGRLWLLGGAATVVAVLGVVLFTARDAGDSEGCNDAAAAEDTLNILRSVTTTEDGVEIELWSREPFPVRALVAVLRIGDVDLAISRYPDSGSLNTLIFRASVDEFEQMAEGDETIIYYGSPDLRPAQDVGSDELVTDGANFWSFGPFPKERLDCPPV